MWRGGEGAARGAGGRRRGGREAEGGAGEEPRGGREAEKPVRQGLFGNRRSAKIQTREAESQKLKAARQAENQAVAHPCPLRYHSGMEVHHEANG